MSSTEFSRTAHAKDPCKSSETGKKTSVLKISILSVKFLLNYHKNSCSKYRKILNLNGESLRPCTAVRVVLREIEGVLTAMSYILESSSSILCDEFFIFN